MLPSIPEKVSSRQGGLCKKMSTPKVYKDTSRTIDLMQRQLGPSFVTNQQIMLESTKNEHNIPYKLMTLIEGQPRSLSNVRSQEQLFSSHCNGLLRTPITDPKNGKEAENTITRLNTKLSPSQRKKMKKLKLLIAETSENLRIRNRSVSIESMNTSPEKKIVACCGGIEPGRQPNGISVKEQVKNHEKTLILLSQEMTLKPISASLLGGR